MARRFLVCLLFLTGTIIFGQQSSSDIQDRIDKVKEDLGDALLTSADDVISRYVESIGGKEAISSVQTMMFKGKIITIGSSENQFLYRYYQQPNWLRVSRSLDNKRYTLCDGEKVWSVTPDGRKELNTWWALSLSHARIDGNFMDYENQRIEYEYIGLTGFESESSIYYHLRRKFPDGIIEELYFDVETGLLHGLRKTSSSRNNAIEFYYEYRRIGHVLVPHMWATVFDKATPPHFLLIEEIRINEDFGENFFSEYKEKPILK